MAGLDPFNTSDNGASLNWFNQETNAVVYANDKIHVVRSLAMEPTTDRHHGPKSGRLPGYGISSANHRSLGATPTS